MPHPSSALLSRPLGRTPVRAALLAILVLYLASLLPIAAATPLAAPVALGSHTANPSAVTIAGSLQSELGCPDDWQPECAATHLTYDADDDVWQQTFTLPAGSYEYKAPLNDSWTENYGANATSNGANIPLNLASGASTKFYYDHKSHWVTSNQNSVIAVAPGSFQSELGCPGDWSPDCLRSWLQDTDGDGTYTFVTTAIPPGSYEGKVALNESWDENYGAGGAPGGANIAFTVPAAGATTTFSYASATHVLTITSESPTGPSHDNNVEWDGLRHDSRDSMYRTPGGAVAAETRVTLRFRTFHDDVTAVAARFFSVRTGGATTVPMTIAAADVPCFEEGLDGASCDLWQGRVPAGLAAQADNLWYRFVVTDGTDTDYYADDTAALDGGLGEPSDTVVEQSWALTQFVKGFTAPAWAKDAFIYQIFPDRFRNGRKDNDPKTGDIRYDDPVLKLGWNVLPEGYCRGYAVPDTQCPNRFGGTTPREQPRGRDYMGGDLKGVDQQLAYLQSLGVNAIYFNPIFDAGSNHSYDTQDYTKVDPYFGSQKDFDSLVKHAKALGIRVILDGVFNHMSSDSPLFDRYHHYATAGACESATSPYRSWFVFTDTAPGGGPCVSSTGVANSARYEAWFGFDSIPVLQKSQAAVQAYFLTANDSITKQWLKAGASGWRMDVSGDASFPNGYWESFRSVVKAQNPDALTVSETWQKDSTLLRMIRGDRLDTTMNYRIRDAVLGFLAPGSFDPKGFADSGAAIEPSAFLDRMASQREDYADAAYYSLMNLLDSHDTERLLWTLTPGAETPAAREQDAANVAAGKQRVRLASLIQFTVPGAPTVYYGDEVGLTGDDDPDDRRTYPWADLGGSPDTALFAHYQALASLRRSVPALTAGDFKPLLADDAADVAAYGRRTSSSAAVVVLNRSSSAQQVHVPLAGWLRDGVAFTTRFPAGGPTVSSAGGEVVVTVPALSGLVLVANAGQDLAGPAAPASLTATAGSGSVALDWASVSGASTYVVYRSVVTGGGYEAVGAASGTHFDDTGVTNGVRAFYVVRAVDAAGNEGAASPEAAATPSFPVGWANLQWPPTITITRGQTTPTIYGQVYVPGLTDSGGPTSAILAQVGFGSPGSAPSSWTTWKAMAFNVQVGNNYEYQATLKPVSAGTFDYLARYSTDGGDSWAYADLSGPVPGGAGAPQPGILIVNAPDDTTAPAAPTDLHVDDWAASFIELAWTAPSDPDVTEYNVYRSEDGGPWDLLTTVASAETSYRDESVSSGTTYGYRVTAVDGALNESAPSNEVSQIAEPKLVAVTFRVRVPDSTPDSSVVYLPGSIDALGPWNPAALAMEDQGDGIWEVTVPILDGTALEYKYARGAWERVEWWGSITSTANRHVTISYGTDGTQLVDNTSTDWETGSDEDKAVEFWRDPLVASASGSASSVVATFERDVQPALADFSTSIVVESAGSPVAGSIIESSAGVLTWTPAATLGAGSYDVTVYSVKSDLGGDSVPMDVPYEFTFNVP